MKKCSVCGIEKEDSEFHLNKVYNCLMCWCKKCHSIKNMERNKLKGYSKTTKSIEWRRNNARKLENKIKAHNYYINIAKPKNYTKLYRMKYPEVVLAQTASESIIVPSGMEKHHWSYNPNNYMDVIFLPKHIHRLAHQRMKYNQDELLFYDNNGILLDSKYKHNQYILSLIT